MNFLSFEVSIMSYLRFFEQHKEKMYLVFRVFVGLLFAQHGMQKLFGWFGGLGGGQAAALFSLMGVAGVIELFGGLAIAIGLFSRLMAILGALLMVAAYG